MIEEEICGGEGTQGLNYPGQKAMFEMERPLTGGVGSSGGAPLKLCLSGKSLPNIWRKFLVYKKEVADPDWESLALTSPPPGLFSSRSLGSGRSGKPKEHADCRHHLPDSWIPPEPALL